jgi:TonB family protein
MWMQTPTPLQIAEAFPKQASGLDIGRVVLNCAVTGDGKLAACQVAAETPAARGFGDAAKSLAPDFLAKVPADTGGGASQVTLPITFYPPGAEKIDSITQPVWTRWVDPKTAKTLLPAKAIEARVGSGQGVVDCVVDHAGQLTQCQSVEEQPPGLGFGDSAVQVANLAAINPWTLQGRPVDGAHIRVPVRINLPPPPPAYDTQPDWTRTPDADDVAAAYPAAGRGLTGEVRLDCTIMANGRLGPCVMVAESPVGLGFGASAMRLALIYAMRPTGPDGKSLAGEHVILAITLRAP